MVHVDLINIEKLLFQPLGFTIENIEVENESAEYGAAEFTASDLRFKFRVGKITPTKVGQFVTFWKRIDKGPIMPYDVTDVFDKLLVSVSRENDFGLFIFPKSVLCEKGIISSQDREGKRAMRIYPSWDKADNPQAKKTQAWQLQYFVDASNGYFDSSRIRDLLSF